MAHLLDTNVCIRLLNGTSKLAATRLASCRPEQVWLSAIVKAELLYGARHSLRVSENLDLLKRFFAPFRTIPFDDRCAAEYGILRAHLRREGTPVGPNDTLIAATALAHDCVLVTANERELGRVPGLRLENWERDRP